MTAAGGSAALFPAFFFPPHGGEEWLESGV
jgi:hypothetical protein